MILVGLLTAITTLGVLFGLLCLLSKVSGDGWLGYWKD
jgi:hypothetical protein